jgi:hypothetical protein
MPCGFDIGKPPAEFSNSWDTSRVLQKKAKKQHGAKVAIKRPDLRLPSQSEIALDF